MISCRQFLQLSFQNYRRLLVYNDIIPTTATAARHRYVSFETRCFSPGVGKSNWLRNKKTVQHIDNGQPHKVYGCGHVRTDKNNKVKYFRGQVSWWTNEYQEQLRNSIDLCERRVNALFGSSRTYLLIQDSKEYHTTTKLSNASARLPNEDGPVKRSASVADNADANTTTYRRIRENIWTIPNLLCVVRMGMAPILGYMVLHSQFAPAMGLLVVAGITDLLDGWIARLFPSQSSMMGSFLDPMADKILIGTLFLSLTYINLIPLPLTVLVLGRDAFLIGAGFYIRHQSLQPPRTLARYFDVTSPSAQLAPTFISKVNTGVQLSLLGATLLSTLSPIIEHSHLVFIWYCTGGSTILSALSYVFARDTYRVLKKVPTTTEDKDKMT